MNDEILALWRGLMEQGTKLLGQEHYADAEIYFIKGSKAAYDLNVPEILAFTLRLLATTRVKLRKIEAAENEFNEALEICKKIKNDKGMAEAWAGLASVAVIKGSLEDAVVWYEKSIEIYPESSPRLRLGMLYSDLGQVYTSLEKWDKAEEAYKQARELCHNNNYIKGEAELSILLGEVFYRKGAKNQAKQWLRKASQLFALTSDFKALANSLQYLAFLHFDMEEMELARESQHRAVVLWFNVNDTEEISESCYFLSKIEQTLEEDKEAEMHLEISIKYYTKEDLGLALRFQSVAGLALLKYDLTKAEEYYLEALKIFKKQKDDFKVGEIYEALAYIVEAQGREREALDFHQKSLNSLKGYGIHNLDAVQRLAEFYEKRRNFYEALHKYWQALEIANEIGVESNTIEQSIQRVSKKIRTKRKMK